MEKSQGNQPVRGAVSSGIKSFTDQELQTIEKEINQAEKELQMIKQIRVFKKCVDQSKFNLFDGYITKVKRFLITIKELKKP